MSLSTRVNVLFEGYSNSVYGGETANCSCTLIRGTKTVIVDTMTAWDGPKILGALKEYSLTPKDIDYVVSTHGHSDHIGNNNLFLEAKHIVGWLINHGDRYFVHPFERGVPYRIEDGVTVLATPGHTATDVSVIVKNVEGLGTVVVAGDLFENEKDIEDERIWKSAGSEDEELQKQNRMRVLQMADYIVPGHGPMFKVLAHVGLGIALYDITKIGDSHILPGDGGHHTPVEFRFVMFRPFPSEVLYGKVKGCTRDGVHVTLGFFDDIFIPEASLQHPSRFDEAEQVWVWEYEVAPDSKHDLFMDVGEPIRFKIVSEHFEETLPPSSEAGGERESMEQKAPYLLHATIGEQGLGLISWWKQEEETAAQSGAEEEGDLSPNE